MKSSERHVAKGPYADLACHRGPQVTRNRLIELREAEIDVVIRRGLLRSDARNDVFAVRDALHAYLDRTPSKAM